MVRRQASGAALEALYCERTTIETILAEFPVILAVETRIGQGCLEIVGVVSVIEIR